MAFFHYPNGKLTQTAKKMVSAERRKESQKQNYSCASFPLLYQPEISHKRTNNKKKDNPQNREQGKLISGSSKSQRAPAPYFTFHLCLHE